eukprot:scaffold33577_cov68-Phaeocystis_antarctica.AAC.4
MDRADTHVWTAHNNGPEAKAILYRLLPTLHLNLSRTGATSSLTKRTAPRANPPCSRRRHSRAVNAGAWVTISAFGGPTFARSVRESHAPPMRHCTTRLPSACA